MRKKKKYSDEVPVMESAQLERAFITTVLSHVNATGYVRALRHTLTDDDFTDDDCLNMWHWCVKCDDDMQEVNMVNVYAQAQKQGKECNIARYVQTNGSEGDVMTIATTLHVMGVKRMMTAQAQSVVMSLTHDVDYTPQDAVAEIEDIIKQANATSSTRATSWHTLHRSLLQVTEDKANGKIPQGTPTGFKIIDRKGGLERGELMVIAGRNSNGKTSFALCLAIGCAQHGTPVGIFSLEMTNLQLGTRIASILSGVNGESIKRGDMTQGEWGKLVGVDGALPIYFDEVRTNDIDKLMGNIQAMHAQKGVQVFVIDYLQLLRSRERERVQQIGNIAHQLEALSKRLEVCIILLSQLRRNTDRDPTPRLEELKESGDIADAADTIYMVYRPERHGANFRYPDMSEEWSQYSTSGTALVMCLKNRMGAMDKEQMLGFDSTTTRFYERDVYERESNPAPDALDDLITPF